EHEISRAELDLPVLIRLIVRKSQRDRRRIQQPYFARMSVPMNDLRTAAVHIRHLCRVRVEARIAKRQEGVKLDQLAADRRVQFSDDELRQSEDRSLAR